MRRPIVLAAGLTGAAVLGLTAFAVVRSGQGQEAETPIEVANRKLANAGQPTLPADYTYPTISTSPYVPDPWTPTPGPSPTPVVPVCPDANITGAEEIVAEQGSARSVSCAAIGVFLYFLVPGANDRFGGVAVFMCAKECMSDVPDQPGRYAVGLGESGQWTFYPAPYSINKVMGFLQPETLLIAPGQLCFNMRTGEYSTTHPCVPEPTVPPEPWPVTPRLEPTAVDLGSQTNP